MAMKDIMPSSAADLPSSSRRCIRISTCFFISGLIVFVLVAQFDPIVHIDTQQVQDLQHQVMSYLHKKSSPSSSSSSPSTGSLSSLTSSPLPPPPPPPLVTSSSPPPPPPVTSLLPPPSSASSTLSSSSLSSNSSSPSSSSSSSSSRIAICLVGGARAFELTGPTIKKYLLQAVANSDVFVNSPLDKDSYKLSILKNDVANLAHVRIFSPKPIPESRVFTEALTASNSPNGIQGLLQYFNLVEGCYDMIKQYQLQYNLTYEWIIRTRLDGYWNNFLPFLERMNHTAYTVPIGSQFGGLNDRLGIGTWETSEVALARLSLVPVLHSHGARGLNSETAFKQQLKVHKVAYKKKGFPFCILSHRKYGWPPGYWGVPVLSLSSKGNLNGAKCRPCTPVSTGVAAKSIIEAQAKSWSWPGNIKAPELCNPTGGWEANWEDVFDRVAGIENAKIRKSILSQTLSACIEANEELQELVEIWDAPNPNEICERGLKTGVK